MDNEIKMSVSSMTRTGDKKAVYVLFQDVDKTAEFTLPGCELVKNKGFTDEDIRQLKDYIDNEQDTIFAMARQVNPIKAMMGNENKIEGYFRYGAGKRYKIRKEETTVSESEEDT